MIETVRVRAAALLKTEYNDVHEWSVKWNIWQMYEKYSIFDFQLVLQIIMADTLCTDTDIPKSWISKFYKALSHSIHRLIDPYWNPYLIHFIACFECSSSKLLMLIFTSILSLTLHDIHRAIK